MTISPEELAEQNLRFLSEQSEEALSIDQLSHVADIVGPRAVIQAALMAENDGGTIIFNEDNPFAIEGIIFSENGVEATPLVEAVAPVPSESQPQQDGSEPTEKLTKPQIAINEIVKYVTSKGGVIAEEDGVSPVTAMAKFLEEELGIKESATRTGVTKLIKSGLLDAERVNKKKISSLSLKIDEKTGEPVKKK